MRKNIITLLLLCASATPLYASPYFTDDSDVTDFKQWAFELSGTFVHPHDDPNEKGANLEVKYGLFPEAELAAEFSYEHISHDRNNDVPSLYGIGDSEVTLKYRLVQESASIPALAIAPKIGVPTGNNSNNLSNQRVWYELPIWFEKNFGEWSTSGGLGYTWNPATDAENFLFSGIKVQRDIKEKINLGLELYYQGADSVDNEALTLLNLGAAYSICKNLQLELGLARSVHGQPQTVVYLGVSI